MNRWKALCVSDKELRPVNWTMIAIYDVSEKHAARVAWKLTERGAPFDT